MVVASSHYRLALPILLVSVCLAGAVFLSTRGEREPSPPTNDQTPPKEAPKEQVEEELGLAILLVEGPDLHSSLRTLPNERVRHLPAGMKLPQNPYLSDNDDFVLAISRSSSQGRLDRRGIKTALYGRYAAGDIELGIYGLEAASDAAAEEREASVRKIWSNNHLLGRASVHRHDRVLLVIWHDGVSSDCWAAVNANVEELLRQSSSE